MYGDETLNMFKSIASENPNQNEGDIFHVLNEIMNCHPFYYKDGVVHIEIDKKFGKCIKYSGRDWGYLHGYLRNNNYHENKPKPKFNFSLTVITNGLEDIVVTIPFL